MKKKTIDAIDILYQRFYKGKPERLAQLEEARANDALGRKIYALRRRIKQHSFVVRQL